MAAEGEVVTTAAAGIGYSDRAVGEFTWQLYNMASDPLEAQDVAADHPDVQRLARAWYEWALRSHVVPRGTPGPGAYD